jgi:hypothetical protein
MYTQACMHTLYKTRMLIIQIIHVELFIFASIKDTIKRIRLALINSLNCFKTAIKKTVVDIFQYVIEINHIKFAYFKDFCRYLS